MKKIGIYGGSFNPITYGHTDVVKNIITKNLVDEIWIMPCAKNNKKNLEKAEKIYKALKKQNMDVLLDDVDENMSNKFKKHDLIGTPYQIIIGSKSEENKFEFKELNSQSEILSVDDI